MPANTGHIGDIFAWVQSACIVHALLNEKNNTLEQTIYIL